MFFIIFILNEIKNYYIHNDCTANILVMIYRCSYVILKLDNYGNVGGQKVFGMMQR